MLEQPKLLIKVFKVQTLTKSKNEPKTETKFLNCLFNKKTKKNLKA